MLMSDRSQNLLTNLVGAGGMHFRLICRYPGLCNKKLFTASPVIQSTEVEFSLIGCKLRGKSAFGLNPKTQHF